MGCLWSRDQGGQKYLIAGKDELYDLEGVNTDTSETTDSLFLPPLVVKRKGREGVETIRLPLQQSKTLIQLAKDKSSLIFQLHDDRLLVVVRIIHLTCCGEKLVWSFSTSGLSKVGQDELVLLIEFLPTDDVIPNEVFELLRLIYKEATRGNCVSHLGFTQLGERQFLGSFNHAGFLYFKPTFQCVRHLTLPQPPHMPLFMMLIHRHELPWLRNLPLRLLLRMGLEESDYPCSLVNRRFRAPVFTNIGETPLKNFCDFETYRFQLPWVEGLNIEIHEEDTVKVLLPEEKYTTINHVIDVFDKTSPRSLPLAADFSVMADGHLIVTQEGTNYKRGMLARRGRKESGKAIRSVGASFIVLAVADETQLTGATSVLVEDGIIVQLSQSILSKVQKALLEHKDYTLHCVSFTRPEQKVGLHSGRIIHFKWMESKDYVTSLLNSGNFDQEEDKGKLSGRVHSVGIWDVFSRPYCSLDNVS